MSQQKNLSLTTLQFFLSVEHWPNIVTVNNIRAHLHQTILQNFRINIFFELGVFSFDQDYQQRLQT